MTPSGSSPSARPLSPHLEIYRLPLVAVLSITHRITGVANLLGSIMLTIWLISAAAPYSGCFEAVQSFMGSWIGRLMLLGWTLSLSYHLLNGVRHLFWDAGKGYDIKTATLTGKIVIAGAVVLTALIWLLAL